MWQSASEDLQPPLVLQHPATVRAITSVRSIRFAAPSEGLFSRLMEPIPIDTGSPHCRNLLLLSEAKAVLEGADPAIHVRARQVSDFQVEERAWSVLGN